MPSINLDFFTSEGSSEWRVSQEDRKGSQPAFVVLRACGFITPLGCICAVPILHDSNPYFLVCPERLKVAALALGMPLRKKTLMHFTRTGRPGADSLSLLIQPRLVADQWREVEKITVPSALFAERFWKYSARVTWPHAKACMHPVFEWFGVGLPAEALDDSALRACFSAVDLAVASEQHYGFDWLPLTIHRVSEVLLRRDASDGHFPSKLAFLTGYRIPGPPLRLEPGDCLARTLRHIIDKRHPGLLSDFRADTLSHLKRLGSDGRIIHCPAWCAKERVVAGNERRLVSALSVSLSARQSHP